MEIEVTVKPNSSSLKYYGIWYRPKKKFNWFNPWKRLVEVWDGAMLTYDQPVLFDRFEHAVDYAKKLKENPKLIEEHYAREDAKYNAAKERREAYRRERSKSTIL